MVQARNTSARFDSSPGSKRSSTRQPKNSSWDSSTVTAVVSSQNDRGVMSVRYHFSNRSEDILGLFTAALDALEIPWTRSSKYIVSIYRKAATARLDTFVGPKDRAVPLNSVHYTA